MRSSYKFSNEATELYFITFTIVEWIPMFTNKGYCNIMIDNLKFYRREQGLKIHYYVIMDNHLHLIVSSNNNVSRIIKNLKSYTAKEIIKKLKSDRRKWILSLLKYYKKKGKRDSEYQVWQEGSHPQIVNNYEMLNQKINYIHFNPVKRGLVSEPEHWIYSSARNYAGKDYMMDVDELEF